MKEIIIAIGAAISIVYHTLMVRLCYALSKIGVMSIDRALLLEIEHTGLLIDGADKLYSLGCFDYKMTMKMREELKKIIRALDDIRA